jgi:2-C-methyl-D-erythritol 4-phosphate cytidylyltransferase
VDVSKAQTWAIVLAGGSGDRFGGLKQFADVCGRPMLEWSCRAAAAACDQVVLVLPSGRLPSSRPVGVSVAVAGGATRRRSVAAGLDTVPATARTVVVHDAAHPAASSAVFAAVLATLSADGAAAAVVPVTPVNETLVWVGDDGLASAVAVGRGTMQVQMPQAFRAGALRRAVDSDLDGADEASILLAMGERVTTVAGDARNIHVTNAVELALVSSLLDPARQHHHND